MGYFASVLTLRAQLAVTFGLLIGAFVLVRFLSRWTLVSRRGLAIRQALRRREAILAEDDADVPSLDEVKSQAVDIVEVEAQTTQLFKLLVYLGVIFGLWGIWSTTLTALEFLDGVRLWGGGTTEIGKVEAVPFVSGGTEEGVVSVPEKFVSLQDLLVALVVFGLTFVAARNIPGLLSLTVFDRIQLGPGGNFALTTTLRYLIVLVGVVIGLQMLGITWGKVQWLAAAITLGIGFGLQEIFANFVAGIILLFERPIRLGDTVTIGSESGKVSQIQIRATTIKQFDGKELLVPNRELITGQLVNWTLRDTKQRFELVVGLAYGSDTKLAEKILKEILEGHPEVIRDPGPQVLFSAFGASTLDFQIRGFVDSPGELLSTKSELHFQIDEAFREAGLEMAFPQQDVHVKSFPDGMGLSSGSES